MYVSGIVAILILILAILLMLGIVPLTPQIVGGMFLAVCLGFAGPYIVRTS